MHRKSVFKFADGMNLPTRSQNLSSLGIICLPCDAPTPSMSSCSSLSSKALKYVLISFSLTTPAIILAQCCCNSTRKAVANPFITGIVAMATPRLSSSQRCLVGLLGCSNNKNGVSILITSELWFWISGFPKIRKNYSKGVI